VAEARGKFAGEPVEAQFASGLPSISQDTSEILPIEMAVRSESTQASVKGTVQDPFSPGRATGDFTDRWTKYGAARAAHWRFVSDHAAL
jgi:hypothetical protein